MRLFSVLNRMEVTKVKEFCHFYKRWSVTRRKRLRCASDTETLGILVHFSHLYKSVFVADWFTMNLCALT